MNLLSSWILSVLLATAPSTPYRQRTETEADMKARYSEIANDMAEAIHESKPLFGEGQEAEVKEAALITSVAFFESGFIKKVDEGSTRGDGGRSWCMMQINIGNGTVPLGSSEMRTWTGKDLVKDRKKCFMVGIEYLRQSIGACSGMKGADILSAYTSGHCVSGEPKAKARWSFASSLRRKHPFPAPVTDSDREGSPSAPQDSSGVQGLINTEDTTKQTVVAKNP